MKYALIPVLKEVEEFIEEHNFDDYEVDYFMEVAMQSDRAHEHAIEALGLLHKIYHANKDTIIRE